ncbi:hypothetical protein ACWOB4_08825 [Enterococcus songbeiensis]
MEIKRKISEFPTPNFFAPITKYGIIKIEQLESRERNDGSDAIAFCTFE